MSSMANPKTRAFLTSRWSMPVVTDPSASYLGHPVYGWTRVIELTPEERRGLSVKSGADLLAMRRFLEK